MPNMLNMLTAQRNPQIAGLLGQMAPAAPQPQGQGILSKLGNVFSGTPNPNLTAQEQQGVRRDSVVDAGLGMIAASTSPDHQPSVLEALGAGISAGRETAREKATERIMQRGENQRQHVETIRSAREEAEFQIVKKRQAAYALADTTTPAGQRALVQGLVQAGDVEGARIATETFAQWRGLDATERAQAESAAIYDSIDQSSPGSMILASLGLQRLGLEGDAAGVREAAAATQELIKDGQNELVTINDQLFVVDASTKEIIGEPIDASMNAAERAADMRARTTERRLQAELDSGAVAAGVEEAQDVTRSISEDFRPAASAYGQMAFNVRNALTAPDTGTGEGTLIYALVNLRDLGKSTVREGEVAMIQASASVRGRADVWINRLENTDVLGEDEERELRAEIARMGEDLETLYESEILTPFMSRLDRENEAIVAKGGRPLQYGEVLTNPFDFEGTDPRFQLRDPRLRGAF